jgi:octaprenyl-diphosphate synthase
MAWAALERVARRHHLTSIIDHLGTLPSSIWAEFADTERKLRRLEAATPGPAARAVRHLLGSGGKRIRPLVCLLAARAFPTSQPRADLSRLAQVAEMVHSASLLHDDVIDQGRMRRGRPAARVLYGNAASVLGGDLLLVRAFDLTRRTGIPGLTGTLLRTVGRMIASEALQLERRGRLDVTADDYFDIVSGKTAALFEWAAEAGAKAAYAPETVVKALRIFGHEVGMAFQLVDDVLDLSRDPKGIGKSAMQDLASGTLTYPVIHAARSRPECIALLGRADQDAETVGRSIVEAVEATGGLAAARREIDRRTSAAVNALASLPATPARTVMKALASQLADRFR